MSELEQALAIANRWLDDPGRDPDGDECVVARQFIRNRSAALTDDEWEILGQLVDKLDNGAGASELGIRLTPRIHVEGLTATITKTRDALKKFCTDRGFDPWSE